MADDGIHDKVVELLRPYLRPDTRMLVCGAGQGSLEDSLIRSGLDPRQISAVDIDPSGYRVPQVRCRQCDLNTRIPFDDGAFDLVVATEVIEHLTQPQRLIDEAHRVLADAGTFLITTPNVHSLAQKVRYLFTDKFDYFAESDFRGSGHLHPIFDWLIKRMYEGKFELLKYDSYSFHLRPIPGLPAIPVPIRSRLFSPNNMYVMRKLHV
jgi:SAM-dependent methyltransferase